MTAVESPTGLTAAESHTGLTAVRLPVRERGAVLLRLAGLMERDTGMLAGWTARTRASRSRPAPFPPADGDVSGW
ncbi:hypothetical protein ACGFNV_03600 [Streptomyces sp. NPDC048751]|uniref:hypothetical protein n=1 Tax=Streptomyces sp. NPDC048751 TaxID=3365591 RepID=UPI0037120EEA